MSQPPQPSQPLQGAQVELRAGSLIFAEGDPGGDLYFIREGVVEVFRRAAGFDVRLASLTAGEVLGIMTCLTREPRLASARALTDVKVLVVKQAGIKSLITTTPPWVHTVIKDFILRIKNMDELYAHAVERLGQAEGRPSLVRTAVQLAQGLAEVGALMATRASGDDRRIVDVDVALGHLARILDTPRAWLDDILTVFLSVGLLKADPGAGVKRAELGVLDRLTAYADFVHCYLDGGARRAPLDALSARDCAFLATMPDAAKREHAPLTVDWEAPLSRLAADGFPPELIAEVLDRAEAAGLVRLDRGGAETVAVFTPMTLGATVRSLLAVKRLTARDEQLRAAAGASPAQAAHVLSESF